MMRLLITLLFSFTAFSSYAVNDDYENLARSNELASKRLQLSNTNLQILKNESERIKVKKVLNQMGGEIIAISSNALFVKDNNVLTSLTIGDKFKGSTIKSISNNSVTLNNGKTLYVND